MRKGTTMSAEGRAKIAEANRCRVRKPWSDEQRANVAGRPGRKTFLGKKHTEETKDQISASVLTHYQSEPRVRQSKQPKVAKPRGQFWKGKKLSAATRKKMSTVRKGRPQSGEHTAKRIASIERTETERMVAIFLTALGVEFIEQHPFERFVADFFVPSKNLIIECDGYWHFKSGEEDEKRDMWFHERGYTVLRLPDAEIYNGESISKLKVAVG